MKTNFQPEEVLTAEDLNANFTECAGKADVDHGHTLEDIEDFDGSEIKSGGENEPAYVRAYTTVVGSLKRHVKAFCDKFILSIRGEEDVVISSTNLPNLVRALSVPDSTPTVDSDNLITSGGVAAALAGIVNNSKSLAISESNGTITIAYNELHTIKSLDDLVNGVFLANIYYGEAGTLGGYNGGGLLIMKSIFGQAATQIILDGEYIYKRTRSTSIEQGSVWSAWTKTAILQ